MQTASQLPNSQKPSTPLVNLFAYIRDLFHTAQPERHFDIIDGKRQTDHWFAVQELMQLLSNEAVLPFSWQADNPDKPLLEIKRVEGRQAFHIPDSLQKWVEIDQDGNLISIPQQEEAFAEDTLRIKIYESFYEKAHGKGLDEVSDLIIPDNLEPWVILKEEEGKITVSHHEKRFEAFEADAERVALFAQIQGQQNFSTHATKLNIIYDKLHSWLYQLKAQPDYQVFFSFGLLKGGSGKNTYQNYLFHVPLRIELERQEIRLYVDTVASEIRCEQHFSELIPAWFPNDPGHIHEQRQREVIQQIDRFQQKRKDFSLETDYITHTYYHPALDILGIFPDLEDQFFQQGTLNFPLPEEGKDHFTFSFSPAIQLRNPGIHINVSKDAAQIMEHIQGMGPQEANAQVPAFFKKLFSLKKPDNPLRIAYKKSQDFRTQSISISEEPAGPNRLYFPLPFNEEQKAIAERLYEDDAATVQGPPGTGKSHTIANLAAHYAAEGKSVLIVSKYAKALEVIRGKLPESIRDLALSFADNEQHRELLKHAIDAVKARLNQPIDPQEIAELETVLDASETRLVDLQNQLNSAIQTNQLQARFWHPETGTYQTLSLSQWAQIWTNAPQTIMDPIHPDVQVEAWAEALFPLLQKVQEIDLGLSQLFLPAPEHLPQPEEVHTRGKAINQWREKIEDKGYHLLPDSAFQSEWNTAWSELAPRLKWLKNQENIWNAPYFSSHRFQQGLEKAHQLHQKIKALSLPELDVQVASIQGVNWAQLPHIILHLKGKFNKQGNIPLLRRNSINDKEKALMNCRVNGVLCDQPDRLELLNLYIKKSLFEAQIIDLATAFVEQSGAQIDEALSPASWFHWEKGWNILQELQVWNRRCIQHHIAPVDPWSANWDELESWWENLPYYKAYKQARAQYHAMQTRIPQMESAPMPLRALSVALEEMDGPAYEKAFEAYLEFSQEVGEVREIQRKIDPWEEKLPHLIQSYHGNEPITFANKADLNMALLAAQIRPAIESALVQTAQTDGLLNEIRFLQHTNRQTTRQLIELKAWHHKQLYMTDEQRSALSAWRNDLINLGKGYGKNASRHLESAIHNLKLAKGVVPIWIMSLDAAIRFFPEPEPGQFDLLIVDEASQVDISALNLIYRAKKTLVVGDENQTSVFTNSAMFPIERTNQILDRYLIQHPFKQQFNINNRTASIYSLSGVIYPNVITLREHFRCRPEIISFSNQFVYDKHIVPLRSATHDWYGAPAEVHYIEDTSRDKKKAKLAESVLTLIEGVIEDYEQGMVPKLPSIGILCLESSNELHRELIQRMILKSSRIKPYQDELRLLVGTSREFQGDERDVMILTTTAHHTLTKTGTMRAPRAVMGEEMMRIYNVAVSRAREKVILLHSIHPEAVAMMNENCYRARLIRHLTTLSLTQGHTVLRKVKTLSPLQESIQTWINEVLPEAEITWNTRLGPYQMDLSVKYQKGKWAIWIDDANRSDATRSLEHQMSLERAGWQGFRISSLEWKAQPQKVQIQILSKLQHLKSGI